MRPPSSADDGGDGDDRRCPEARAGVVDLQGLRQFICKCESSRGLPALFAYRSSSVPGLDLLREFPENSNGGTRVIDTHPLAAGELVSEFLLDPPTSLSLPSA